MCVTDSGLSLGVADEVLVVPSGSMLTVTVVLPVLVIVTVVTFGPWLNTGGAWAGE